MLATVERRLARNRLLAALRAVGWFGSCGLLQTYFWPFGCGRDFLVTIIFTLQHHCSTQCASNWTRYGLQCWGFQDLINSDGRLKIGRILFSLRILVRTSLLIIVEPLSAFDSASSSFFPTSGLNWPRALKGVRTLSLVGPGHWFRISASGRAIAANCGLRIYTLDGCL